MIKCLECGFETQRLQWTHFKYKCTGQIKSVKEYQAKYPGAPTVCSDLAKQTAVTKDKMVEKYGIEEGVLRWEQYRKKQAASNSFEYKKDKYGWDRDTYDSYNKSRAVTLENMIERHGEINGLLRWNEYCERQSYTNTEQYFIEKYGEKDGLELWLSYNKEKGKSNDPAFVSEKYRISFDEAVQLIAERKGGLEFTSKSEQSFIDDVEKVIGRNLKYSYKTKQYAIWNDELNSICFYDGYDSLTNTLIEYNGDFWHCNPNTYSADYLHPIRNMTAKEIWEADRKKINAALDKGLKVIVVWESEYNKGDDRWKKMLKELK